jgi:tRNA(His) guanylyltransferase
VNDSLGDRMKTYEEVTRTHLVRRTPVVLRLDGKAFHTFTRGLKRPFDRDFMSVMKETAIEVCKEVQGAQLGYVQSDEISVLLIDYKKLDSDGWFDYNIQKMVSVSASIATAAFNQAYLVHGSDPQKFGLFDARVFNVPREDVCNYFIWRQKDATRNSIQSVAQANFPQKQLTGLGCDKLQEKLFQEKGINWGEDFLPDEKRGTGIIKVPDTNRLDTQPMRLRWIADPATPEFTKRRDYVEEYVDIEPEDDRPTEPPVPLL